MSVHVIVLRAGDSGEDVAPDEDTWVVCDRPAWERLDGARRADVVLVPDVTEANYLRRLRRFLQHELFRRQALRRGGFVVEVRGEGHHAAKVRAALQALGRAFREDDGRFEVQASAGDGWVVASEVMKGIARRVERLAPEKVPVLIVGPTGVGKEEVARRLHAKSGREGRFAAVNGALLHADLAESRLFGHVEGAFTGAEEEHAGRIEEAADGTFFLDELFHVPERVQPQLLRALDLAHEGVIRVRRMGGRLSEPVEARLVTACQRHPLQEEGSPVRDDLYGRVAGEVIEISPLRERPEDIAALAERFAEEVGLALDEDAVGFLQELPWPRNVRELRTVVERAGRCHAGEVVGPDELRAHLDPPPGGLRPRVEVPALEVLLAKEELRIRELAVQLEGSKAAAARFLGLEPKDWSRSERVLRRHAGLEDDKE